MSKGSPIVPVRIPQDLLDQMDDQIEQRNEYTRVEPWTRTGFVLAAIREKLAHMARARRPGRARAAAATEGEGQATT